MNRRNAPYYARVMNARREFLAQVAALSVGYAIESIQVALEWQGHALRRQAQKRTRHRSIIQHTCTH
jgi:hypothetical protein